MRFEVSALVRAPVDDVWTWWTEYGAPGSVTRVNHGLGVSRRTVLSRSADVVVLQEAVPLLGLRLLTHHVELEAATRSIRERAGDEMESWWRFEPAPEGTRIVREMELKRAPRWTVPTKLAAWTAQRDLDHHAKEAERELRRGAHER